MGRESHGQDPTVLHSSIALLQERFRQLQRVKEMREERELLKMLIPEQKHQFTNNSKSSMTIPSTTPTPPSLPSPHSHVSLSLWPTSTSLPEPAPRETLSSVATFLEPETPPVYMTLWKTKARTDCDRFDSDSGVDTSLHL